MLTMISSTPDDSRGTSAPLGATPCGGGVNFSVYSRHATGVELLLFDRVDDARPARAIRIDAADNRTYHYWHVFVAGVSAGQMYGYRVEGPSDPAKGMRFDPAKVLLDPYGRGVAVPDGYRRGAAAEPGDNSATAMKSVVVDPSAYDWEGDVPLRRPAARTIIYEMHVRGFTRHPSSGIGEKTRGTFAGLVEKIPYLQELGITAVELLPVFQYDAQDCPPGKVNYWGYAPVSFFAPHQAYSSRRQPLGPVDEFRDMVKALHRAGIEVILDVVFNHTAEGDHRGPTLSFRGLDNVVYYILEENRSRYANYSGTGNTLNANHPIVRRMIVDSLRYWVEAMHVDGFRFDLAAILARDGSGQPVPSPPVLWDIESDPVLAGTKLIAEAWDAAGLYQVGTFIRDSWKVEVAVPRRCAELLPWRAGHGRADGGPAGGEPRDLRSRAAGGRAERQLRDVPRRLHPQRPRLLQRQAQRGERRGQPGRGGRQSQLELRGRGADRRPHRGGAEKPAGEELPDRYAARARHADDPDGRRGAADAGRQQQRLLPGHRDQLVRLDAAREARRRPPLRPHAQCSPGVAARASLRVP
jgi:pullulanase/glycogen debranching enzyme